MEEERERRFDFGVWVGMRREHLGFHEDLLAKACGVSEAVYMDWEESRSLPSCEEQVRQLARALALSEQHLLKIFRRTRYEVRCKGFARLADRHEFN